MSENEREKEKDGEEKSGREAYEWVQALVCSVLAVVMIFTFVIRLIGVDGHSMVPTLQNGDRLLVLNSMLYDDYKYGDIVVLRNRHRGTDGGHRLCQRYRIRGRCGPGRGLYQ